MGVAVLLFSIAPKGQANLHFGFKELGHAMQVNPHSANRGSAVDDWDSRSERYSSDSEKGVRASNSASPHTVAMVAS
jgi:hypothetical protein